MGRQGVRARVEPKIQFLLPQEGGGKGVNSNRAKAPYMAPSIIGRSASFLEETVNRYLTRGLHSTFYIRK